MSFADRTALLVRTVAAHRTPGAGLTKWPDAPLDQRAWLDLTTEIGAQRVWSLLARAIVDGFLPAHDAQLDEAIEQDDIAVLACLHLDRVLRLVWDALTVECIEARVFKGVSSALLAYPEAGLRAYSDVDLLVPGHRFDDACAVVTALGGRRHNPDPRAGFTASLGKSAGFTMDGGWEVDLHRSPQGGPFGAAVPTAELFENATALDVGGTPVDALSSTHLFLTACYHAILPHDERRLVAHLDVVQILLSGVIDEQDVIQTAARWRCTSVVAGAIRSTAEMFAVRSMPLLSWARDAKWSRLEDQWLRACMDRSPRSALRVGLLTASAYRSPRDGVGYVWAQVAHDARSPVRVRLGRLRDRFVSSGPQENHDRESVFQVVDTLSIGGAERMTVDVSNGLARRNWDVHLFATRALGPLADEVDGAVHLHDLARRSTWDVRGIRRFRAAVVRKRPKVVHAHGWSSLRFATVALAMVPNPPALVFHDHRAAGLPPLGRAYHATAWLLTKAHVAVDRRLLAPPLKTRSLLIQEVVPNGVPLDGFAQKRDHTIVGKPRLVALANLRPEKDHPLLLAAVEGAIARGMNVEIDLVGSVSDDDQLRVCTTRIEDLGLGDAVTITGPRRDVGALLATYDAGVLSSSTESGPIALIEYLAAGLPFAVTDVGEIPALLPDGLRRWVVPPGDAIALADAIHDLLACSPDERAAFAEEGSAFARANLSIDRTIDAIEDVYRRLEMT